MSIANECVLRGHHIKVFTRHWEGDKPANIEINETLGSALTNHNRDRNFVLAISKRLRLESYDVLVGFNKMPGLDIYYAADPCYAAMTATKPWYYRLTPRYKHYLAYESVVFGKDQNTRIMAVSKAEIPKFKQYYQTPDVRFHDLPPGINPDRKAPGNRQLIRQVWRDEFEIADDQSVILAVGADFKRKGLSRTIKAIANLPIAFREKVQLFAVGDSNYKPYLQMAERLNIVNQLRCFNGRDDIPRFLFGADALAHPALVENTGNIILEAIIAGLPVIATETCGYSDYIEIAEAGIIVKNTFSQNTYNQLLLKLLTSPQRENWKKNGIKYGNNDFLYQRSTVAADFIEHVALLNRNR